MAYTWETECVELLRNLINDIDDISVYSNERLRRVLVAAAFQVNLEASFVNTYTISLSDQTISPDPTDSATLDDAFVNLMCLKAACIIDTGKATKAAGNAISGRDMNAVQFDLSKVAESTLKLLKEGWCAVYKEVLYNYLSGGDDGLGRAVISPFRTDARFNYRSLI